MAPPETPTRARVESAIRPLLRGYSHAAAASAALAGTVALVWLSAGDWLKQVSLLVYGATSVLLFTASALFHTAGWSPRWHRTLRRLDRAGIFLAIAGTATPIVYNVLPEPRRTGILLLVWGLAGLGAAAVAPVLRTPRGLVIGLYLGLGWIALALIPALLAARGLNAVLLLSLGGLLYTAGALIYALRRPRLWPRVFGFHEAFHLLVIAANAVFFIFMLLYVIPFPRP
jgi:hemolysin III